MIKTYKNINLNRDEFPVTSKVNYISEDLLPVMVTSCFQSDPAQISSQFCITLWIRNQTI